MPRTPVAAKPNRKPIDREGFVESDSEEAALLERIDPAGLPRHVAVIMDGNGRWAQQRRLPRVRGHEAGIQSVREIVETSARLHLEVLTLYAFSIQNWKRPRAEVDTLMRLLKRYLKLELETLQKNDIKFDTIGRVDALPASVSRELSRAREATKNNKGLRFLVALNYGGRDEIVDACQRLINESHGLDKALVIDEAAVSERLYTCDLPDPDLLIRTSGELRVSNFLLWQIAYAEIWVSDTLWPDFRRRHLFEALIDFQHRERRYGAIK